MNKCRLVLNAMICLTLWWPLVATPQTLPPQVTADILNQRIIGLVSKGDREQLIRELDKYYELEKSGVTVPAPLRLVDAKTSKSMGQHTRALCALESYLNAANRRDDKYQQALTLYDTYAEAAKIAEQSPEAQSAAEYCTARRQAASIPAVAQRPAVEPPKTATVFLLRRVNFKIGYNLNMNIAADGIAVGTLKDTATLQLSVPPGKHKFIARWEFQDASNPDMGEIEMEVSAGATYYVRAYCDKNSHFHAKIHMEQLDEATARQTWTLP